MRSLDMTDSAIRDEINNVRGHLTEPIYSITRTRAKEALDRIEKLADAPKKESYQPNINFDPKKYFNDIIGVTRYEGKPVHIIFKVSEGQVPYVRTKPLHKSQREVGSDADGGVLFSIDVIPNRELERDLLGFGEDLTIISPDDFRECMQERICKSLKNYDL